MALGCDQPPTTGLRRAAAQVANRSVVAQDPGMGQLSGIALAVAAGLQDARVRTAIIAAMRDTAAKGYGVDLQDCANGGMAAELFRAAERRGGPAAVPTCAAINQMPGLVLAMEAHDLSRWGSAIIPIVTALSNPSKGLPQHLLGYRSPSRTIDIIADKRLLGPILVVLPFKHPTRFGAIVPSSAMAIVRSNPVLVPGARLKAP